MSITPAGAIEAGLERARLIAAMYADAEAALLERVAARVDKDLDNDDGQDWANKRLAEVTQLRKEAESIVRRLTAAAKAAAQAAVLYTWAEGMDAAVRGAVLQVHDAKLRRRLARVLQDARNLGAKRGISAGQGVAELAAQAVTLVTAVHEGALRAVDDIYRNVVAETAGRVLIGAETRREAAQRALDRFTQGGIKGFTDSASPPRTWGMREYVEMAMRTATARAAVDGHLSTLREAGINLVSVSRLPYTCDRCARWEGEVLALSGSAGTRVEENPATGVQVFVQVAGTVAEARLSGLLHPNCGHNLNAYLPGVSRLAPAVQSKATYADVQRQRYLERKVREQKRRAAVSLDEGARRKADDKAARYEQQLKELAKASGLRRKSGREKADAPPGDLEKLTDEQLAEQVNKFSDDEQVLARLEQEINRRDAEAEAAEKAAEEAEREAAEPQTQEPEWQPPLHPFSTKRMTRDDVVRQLAEWIRIALRDRYGIDHAKTSDRDIVDVWDELRRESEPGTFGASVFEAADRFEDRMANNKTPFYRLVYRSVRRGDRATVVPPDSGGESRKEPPEEPQRRRNPAETDDPIAALRQINDINELSDDDVMALMERYQNDEDGLFRLLEELDRIERQTRDDWSWNWREEETEADRQISDLIATGRYSYMEAYAEVHGLDPAELERQERRALLEADRRPGDDIDQTVRRLYAEWLDQMYERAERATNGFMLNAEARAAGINERSLFSGPASRARKYASEELLRWWADNPRLTLTEFRAQWLGRDSDKRAAAQIRAGGAGREFGV